MKRTPVLVAVLLFILSSLAWAEGAPQCGQSTQVTRFCS
jgi:hypothetical protein